MFAFHMHSSSGGWLWGDGDSSYLRGGYVCSVWASALQGLSDSTAGKL